MASVPSTRTENTGLLMSLLHTDFLSFECISSGKVEPYGTSIFSMLNSLYMLFLDSGTNLHFHLLQINISFNSLLLQHLLSLFFFVIASLTKRRWYLIVVLIYIFLRSSGIKHVCLYLLALLMYFRRYLLWSIYIFNLHYCCFAVMHFEACIYSVYYPVSYCLCVHEAHILQHSFVSSNEPLYQNFSQCCD